MISNILNSLLIGLLFIDMLERRCPDEFKNCMINLSYNMVYIYSKAQILFIRFNTNINKFIDNNESLLKIKNYVNSLMECKSSKLEIYKFIKDGKETEFYDFNSENKPDFLLFSWPGEDKKCINKKIIYSNECANISEVSDIKFMLVELKIGEINSHKIDLKTDKFNFYIVGNAFTKQFFIYYLKQILKINEEINNNDKFSLKIIDHDVNNITLDFTDKNESITLEKTSYKVNIVNQYKSD